MILAAGLGTRLKPWTDKHPKALVPVNGVSVLERNVKYLQQYGITNVVVNVHHFAGQIIDAININNGWGSNLQISDEQDMVLETGGGLLKAKNFLDGGDFLLMNADILTDLNIDAFIQLHKSKNALATLAVTDRVSSRAFLFNSEMALKGWQNTKENNIKLATGFSANNVKAYAFSGLHIINPAIFELISFTGKFSIVDVYVDLCSTQHIHGFNHSGGKLFDVGTTEKVAVAEQYFF